MTTPGNVTYIAPWGNLVAEQGAKVSLTLQGTFGGNDNVNISVPRSSSGLSLDSDGRLTVVNSYLFSIAPAKYQTFFFSYDRGTFSNNDFLEPLMVA